MNFLQLVQEFRRQARISGTGPSSVVSQTGNMQLAVNWILQAYEDIQNLHTDWMFLENDFSFNTIASTQNYTSTSISLSEFGEWKTNSFRYYLASTGSSGEQWLPHLRYEKFRDWYLFGPARTQTGQPHRFTVVPDLSLSIFPLPDAIYTVVGRYYKKPQTMTANADIPIIPVKYHMIIVYRAMMHYGGWDVANEIFSRGQNEYMTLLNKLERTQLPKMQKAGPLA